MAGYMYLGNKKVCPAIVVKSGYQTKNAYFTENVFTSVDANGKLTASTTTAGDLVFTGFKDVGDNVFFQYFLNEDIGGNVIFLDLEQITGSYAFYMMFAGTNIESISFNKLNKISGGSPFYNFVSGDITDIYFPSLKSDSFASGYGHFAFYDMLEWVGVQITIHFPSNLQSTIAELYGYPNFGGNYTTLAFDLPATS